MPVQRILVTMMSMISLFGMMAAGYAVEGSEEIPVFRVNPYTQGGLGGRVIRVTSLASSGPGTLREALLSKGPRVVVFEVGGVIDLDCKLINIVEPFVTVAGQTAPAPGITLIREGIAITTHDVIIQHICVRPGDDHRPKKCGWSPDGMATNGKEAYNIIIDHCSLTWAVDENLSASGPRNSGPGNSTRNVVFSNCIIAEGLDDSTHSKGKHSKGSLIHDSSSAISVIGNLYAHNADRNPYFKAHTTGLVMNNLIYNPESTAIQLNYLDKEWEGITLRPVNGRLSVVGNVYHHGVDTFALLPLVVKRGDAYLEDNQAFLQNGKKAPMTGGRINVLEEKPFWLEGLSALPSEKTEAYVLRHAGARPKERDPIDQRIIDNYVARKGRIIDSQEEVGGYPSYAPVKRALEIPDENLQGWLATMARAVE